MLKLQILSDFHLEHRDEQVNYNDFIKANKENILALLGDIGSPYDPKLEHFLGWCSDNFYKVLYVPGNHEYYTACGHPHAVIQKELARLCSLFPNVIFLDNMIYDIENVRFIGTTLWTDIPSDKQNYIQRCMNDYRLIYSKHNTLMTPTDVSNEYLKNKMFIENNTIKGNMLDKKVVVLTHHAPSFIETSPPQFKDSDSKYGFASQLTCNTGDIRMWCCGHTHYNFHHKHEGYELISNQIGYDKPVKGYKSDLVIVL
jgi:predicted phosphodiesterase